MMMSGKVVTGVLRGKPLIEKIYFRLIGILGFSPYKGTMDIQLEEEINIEAHSTKAVEHKLIDGQLHRDCLLAPVTLHIKDKQNDDLQYDCWAMQQVDGIYPKNIIEIIAKDKLRDMFNLNDNDVVRVEFTAHKEVKGKTPLSIFKKKK